MDCPYTRTSNTIYKGNPYRKIGEKCKKCPMTKKTSVPLEPILQKLWETAKTP